MPGSEWLHSMSIFPISVTSKRGGMERSNTLDSALSVEDLQASGASEVRNEARPAAPEVTVTSRSSEVTGDCDWGEGAAPDTHMWQPSASGVEDSVIIRHMF